VIPDSASELTHRNILRKQFRGFYILLQLFPVSSQLSAIAFFRICNIVDSDELVGVVLVLMFISVHPARIKGLLEKLAVLLLNGDLETTMGCTVCIPLPSQSRMGIGQR
jgi:hypothetical protein